MKRTPTWTRISRDKAELRRANAAKPFAEKLRALERMRDRDEAIRQSRTAGDSRSRSTPK